MHRMTGHSLHDIGSIKRHRPKPTPLEGACAKRVAKWVAMAAPLPGIGPWDEIVRSPLLGHFNFRGPDVERLAEGWERIYLDRFWNELSANPAAVDEESCQRYAKLYARPGAMHSAFEQFAAFH